MQIGNNQKIKEREYDVLLLKHYIRARRYLAMKKKKYLGGVKRLLTRISPKLEVALNYRYSCGEWLNWKQPQDFNAKINWLKVNTYYNNSKVTLCIDKYRVRDYLNEKGYSCLCPTLYGVYDTPSEIDWEKLPKQFVVKCNHACGTNLIVKDKNKLDIGKAINKLDNWMKSNYWSEGEVQYRFIKKKIIVEEYLGGGDVLNTYKFYCFNGTPKVFYISIGEEEYIDYYDLDFNKLQYTLEGHKHYPKKIQKPIQFNEMLKIAEDLSKDFPFVRVDLYEVKGVVYFSELTFIPTAGFMKIDPPEILKKWGSWLKIE